MGFVPRVRWHVFLKSGGICCRRFDRAVRYGQGDSSTDKGKLLTLRRLELALDLGFAVFAGWDAAGIVVTEPER